MLDPCFTRSNSQLSPAIKCCAGVVSMGVWFWPERNSDDMEAIMSIASSDKKTAMTFGWVNGGMYYTDGTQVSPLTVSIVNF